MKTQQLYSSAVCSERAGKPRMVKTSAWPILYNTATHFDAVWIFPQKCAPSVGRNKPITRSLKKTQKVKANAQGYSHLPTYLMVSIDRYENYLSKKVSLGTQIFIFCQIWQLKKQFYEKVNKFWLVNYEIEQAATYKKSHSVCPCFVSDVIKSKFVILLPLRKNRDH